MKDEQSGAALRRKTAAAWVAEAATVPKTAWRERWVGSASAWAYRSCWHPYR